MPPMAPPLSLSELGEVAVAIDVLAVTPTEPASCEFVEMKVVVVVGGVA